MEYCSLTVDLRPAWRSDLTLEYSPQPSLELASSNKFDYKCYVPTSSSDTRRSGGAEQDTAVSGADYRFCLSSLRIACFIVWCFMFALFVNMGYCHLILWMCLLVFDSPYAKYLDGKRHVALKHLSILRIVVPRYRLEINKRGLLCGEQFVYVVHTECGCVLNMSSYPSTVIQCLGQLRCVR